MELSDQEYLGSPDCPYTSPHGTICNKCGKQHEGPAAPPPRPHPVGRWLAAALDDPKVCQEMKDDINSWFAAGSPTSYDDWMALQEEVEQLRVQLAGCGVAAMQNTRDSVALRAKPGDYGWSASYGDVCAAVDREMDLRERFLGILDPGPVGVVTYATAGAGNGHYFNVNWLDHAALKEGAVLYIVPTSVHRPCPLTGETT